MPKKYVRTCQACQYKLVTSSETKDKTTASYRNRKCPKCRSEAFDWGSWQGYDTQPWRDKFLALTGTGLVMTDNELEELIDCDEEGGGLFEGNDFLNRLIERSKVNAGGISSARTSYQGY
jgi:hypothetical protein